MMLISEPSEGFMFNLKIGLLGGISLLLMQRLPQDLVTQSFFGTKFGLAEVQLIWLVLALALATTLAIVVRSDSWLRRYKYTWAAVGVGLLLLTFVFGTEIKGARRWIVLLGVNIQEGFPCFLTTEHKEQEIEFIRDAFSKALDALEEGSRKFVIDFSKTGYIDSSGLGVLVSLSKKIREQGGELRLAGLNADLQTLFELTKLDTLFQISDTRDRALASF
jgi:anti-sigma B factor antagonist